MPRWLRRLVAPLLMGALIGGVALAAAPLVAPTPAGPGVATSSPSPGGSSAVAPSAPPGYAQASPVPPSPVPPSPSPSPSPVPSVGTLRPVPAAALQRALDAWRVRSAVPGVSVTIRWSDGRVWTGVSGQADRATRVAVGPDTAFALASVSKTFISALVMRLVEDGRLALDEPVAPLLPGRGLDERITVRMLLDHTSGLPDFFSAAGIDKALLADKARTWTADDSLAYAKKGRLTPGSVWRYANTNYLLLGLLIERVTGRPYAVELRDLILAPLGLDGTWVQVDEPARDPIAIGYVRTRTGSGAVDTPTSDEPIQPFRSVVTAAGAAGSVAATSADVARWAEALYGGTVLRPSSLEAMVADATRTAKLHPRVPTGLGVQVETIDGWRTYGHSGHLLGFRTAMRYLPVAGLSIAALANGEQANANGLVAALLPIALPPGGACTRCS